MSVLFSIGLKQITTQDPIKWSGKGAPPLDESCCKMTLQCGMESDLLAGGPGYFDKPEKEKEFWTKEVTLFSEERRQMSDGRDILKT